MDLFLLLLVLSLSDYNSDCVIGGQQAKEESQESDDDSEVEVVYVREPTAEQAELARKLLLPLTFFCYKNDPGYCSDDQTDGESQSHEADIKVMAVKDLSFWKKKEMFFSI